jgi:hypothetical protein
VFVAGPVQGKTLLVTGGAGAVGHYAVQLAHLGRGAGDRHRQLAGKGRTRPRRRGGARHQLPARGCCCARLQWLTVVDKGADGQTSVRELIRVRFSRLETVV